MDKKARRNQRGKKKSKSAAKQQKMKIKSSANPKTASQNDKEKENFLAEHLGEIESKFDLEIKVHTKDIHVPNYTMGRPGGGPELLSETDIQLTNGRKYGLIGKNGHGKTTLLSHIAGKKIPEIPTHLRILHIKQEMPSSENSVLHTVLQSDKERLALLKEAEKLEKSVGTEEGDPKNPKNSTLKAIYDRLEFIESSSAPSRAATILSGLGFDEEMQKTPVQSLSGGWRMRVSIASALFAQPDILLLDEPTNHLDFPAVEWLKNYINDYDNTLVAVSHDRKFLNDVCTDIIHIEDRKLKYYKGDYDTFERVRKEQRKQAKTAYEKQQATIEHNQDFIRRFRANKKLASLAQSRIKILAGMEKLEDVKDDKKFRFYFPEPEGLKKKQLLLIDEMAFGYGGEETENVLYGGVNLRLEVGGVVGVLGRNGMGKSTLIKLILGKLKPLKGTVELNTGAKIGFFAQHHADTLDVEKTPYELLSEKFPKTKHQVIYKKLGQFKLAEKCATKKIKLLSGGEKSRLSFALLSWHEPHLLVMDEPTNHLDLETIDGLIKAIKKFNGGVILISHDEHFLKSVCKEFWAIGVNKEVRAFHDFEKGRDFSYRDF